MKKIFTNIWQVYVSAIIFWVFLFVLSIPLTDPVTKGPWMNIYLFHFIMFILSLVVAYFWFRWFSKKGWIAIATFISFLLVNIVMDFIILIPYFGVSINEWLTLVLPSYIIGTGIMYKLFSNKNKR